MTPQSLSTVHWRQPLVRHTLTVLWSQSQMTSGHPSVTTSTHNSITSAPPPPATTNPIVSNFCFSFLVTAIPHNTTPSAYPLPPRKNKFGSLQLRFLVTTIPNNSIVLLYHQVTTAPYDYSLSLPSGNDCPLWLYHLSLPPTDNRPLWLYHLSTISLLDILQFQLHHRILQPPATVATNCLLDRAHRKDAVA